MYYLYHIPNKKIGVTRDLKCRVEDQQGYDLGEYDVLMETEDIDLISEQEIKLQKAFGYKVDQIPYNKLNCNKDMKINVTEQTTTFPCPVNKLKGQLMDNLGMEWKTDHGFFEINATTIAWIMNNVKTSMYNENRCYVYNKAFAKLKQVFEDKCCEKDDCCQTNECDQRYPDVFNTLEEGIHYRYITPLECERLQTLPDNYTKAVSNSQRYKALGNGWTVDVIVHILNHINSEEKL